MKKLIVGALTHPGQAREHNQDAVATAEGLDPALLAQKGYLCLVADGLGPAGSGAAASNLAIRTVMHEYYGDPSPDVAASLNRAFDRANQAILDEVARNPGYAGMGTTLVAAVVRGNELFVANIGDSRAYLIRAGQMVQISYDHTWVSEQIQAGHLTPAEARSHPNRRHLSRSLGLKPAKQVDHFQQQFLPGDRLLLCSDGLSDLVTDGEIRDVAVRSAPQAAAQQLVAMANQRGGADNIAVVLAEQPKATALAGIPIVPVAAVAGALLILLLVALLARPATPPAVTSPVVLPSPTSPLIATAPGGTQVTVTPGLVVTEPVTGTVAPTATPRPSDTPPAGQPTPLPQPTLPPQATLSPTVLLGPEDGAAFTGPDAVIVLNWQEARPLAADEYYLVTIPYPHDGGTWQEVQWVQQASFQVPAYLYGLLSEPRECRWYVTLMRQTGTDAEGKKEGVALGEPSETRTFVWHLDSGRSGPGPGNTDATPTPTFERTPRP